MRNMMYLEGRQLSLLGQYWWYFQHVKKIYIKNIIAQSAGAVEYTDCTSAER